MGGSGKTSKVSSVVAVLCILIYIAAVAYGAVEIIANMGERRNTANEEFDTLSDRASSSAVFLGFMSDAYKETITDFLNSSETLLGIIITSSRGPYGFERYPGSSIIWSGDTPRFKIQAGVLSKPFNRPLIIDGQRNVNIQAIYGYFDYNFFMKVLRNTLLAVLASLTIAFVTLLLELIQKNRGIYNRPDASGSGSKPQIHKPEFEKKRSVDIIRRPDFGAISKKGTESPAGQFTAYHSGSGNGLTPEKENQAAPVSKVPSQPADDLEEIDTPFDDVDFPEEDSSVDEIPEKMMNPQGLFTPRGNVGWESYTHDRLASELHRCAASEQDLVFIVMEFRGSEIISDTVYRRFTDEVVAFFTMRDMIFEKGQRGISIIIPSTDLEQGFAKSEEFRSKLAARLPESFKGRTELRIGLSSRSGRLMQADRLIMEASRALEKALEDPVSPIVAFKSDPEKYREFIKEHH